MRKHSMPEMKEGGVNVTPLIDVVMCLIIFFMLVAKIGVASGSDKNITVPPAFIGTNIADAGNTMTLNVRNGGEDGPVITALVGSKMETIALRGPDGKTTPLLDTLNYFRKGDPSRGIPENKNFKVIIRGDKTLRFNSLAPVLIACTNAKVRSFAFATNPGQRPGSEAQSAQPAE